MATRRKTARPVVSIRVEDHTTWAKAIARGVARSYRMIGQDAADLEQTAMLALCRSARAFTVERVPADGVVSDAFRGYAHRDIQQECRREAKRIRNGGTYRTRREKPDRPPIVAREIESDRDLVDVRDHTDAADAQTILPGTRSRRDYSPDRREWDEGWSVSWTPGCDDEDITS